MFLRRSAALILAGVLLGLGLTTSPAGAVVVPTVVPDPVTSLTVGTLTQGANHSWVIPFSWDASTGATGYTVKVTNLAGSEDYGTTKDVTDTSTSVTTFSCTARSSARAAVNFP